MERAQENAFEIVKYLQTEPKVKNVYYPGIEGTESYEISKKQARGFGSMLTFEVESAALAKHILKFTKLIPFAESLGGVETLLTYPCTQTHADVPEKDRIANGITDCVLRMSVGIEAAEDLIRDLKEAIDSYDGYKGQYI
jgi:cystathionine gamma-synthase